MDKEYSFQPQINARSRHLARYAPTLRERQEQEERLRGSADRQRPARSWSLHSPVSAARTGAGAQATKPRRVPAGGSGSENDGDDALQSVWALWRAVATGEGRDEERQYTQVTSADEVATMPRPPVVHVTTILAMLSSLGIRLPHHEALIKKFLRAVVAGGDDAVVDVVDAERFAYVFTTVWKAAVTNHTRWSPAPAPHRASRGVSTEAVATVAPIAGHLPRPLCASSTPPVHQASCVPRGVCADLPPRRAGSPQSLTSSPASSDEDSPLSDSSSEACAALTRSASGARVAFDEHESASRSRSTHSEPSEHADDASSEDGSFLRTNLSRASSAPTSSPPTPPPESHTHNDVKPAETLPFFVDEGEGETPGLSLSPEPRNPHETGSPRTASHAMHQRSLFSASASPLASVSMVQQTVRVLPSDSRLLTSTTSRELKKTTKRTSGGLMRECTFKPKINDVSPEMLRRSAETVYVRRTAEEADAALPPFQPNTQQYHAGRAKLAWWTEKPFKHSVYTPDGDVHYGTPHGSEAGGRSASPVPLAPGFDSAVRRMIAARQQQKQLLQPASTKSTVGPANLESAVRRAAHPPQQQPLLYVDVDLPKGETGRVALFRGSDVAEVAYRFSVRHHLDDRLRARLENVLREQLLTFS
jgi:hypothetical protein